MAWQSIDADIVTCWLENNRYLVVRRSSTRGGSEALRRMVRHVCSGHNMAFRRGQMLIGFLRSAGESPASAGPEFSVLGGENSVIDLDQFAPICDSMK